MSGVPEVDGEPARLARGAVNAHERKDWIAYLEAHYGRLTALHVRDTARELRKAAGKVADRSHPQLEGNEGLRRYGQARRYAPEALLQHVIRVSCEEIEKAADEGRQAVMAAKQVRDEDLGNFVRWHTNARWREVMEGLGYRWDDETMRWRAPGQEW